MTSRLMTDIAHLKAEAEALAGPVVTEEKKEGK